jgi:hypothetical protein
MDPTYFSAVLMLCADRRGLETIKAALAVCAEPEQCSFGPLARDTLTKIEEAERFVLWPGLNYVSFTRH